MKLRPLLLDGNSRAEIKRVAAFAVANPIPVMDVWRAAYGKIAPPGDNGNRVCVVPLGYRCAFTHEEHPEMGNIRHLSVSVIGDGYAPNPIAVQELAAEFGFPFDGDLYATKGVGVWEEPLEKGKVAINVIQKLE